jgi:hypothetical protein
LVPAPPSNHAAVVAVKFSSSAPAAPSLRAAAQGWSVTDDPAPVDDRLRLCMYNGLYGLIDIA